MDGAKIIAEIFGTECISEDESLVASMNMVRFPSNDPALITRIQTEVISDFARIIFSYLMIKMCILWQAILKMYYIQE